MLNTAVLQVGVVKAGALESKLIVPVFASWSFERMSGSGNGGSLIKCHSVTVHFVSS